MALNERNFDANGSGSKGAAAFHTYISTDDLLATIVTSGYFNDLSSILSTGDLIYVVGTDASALVRISVSSGVVSVAATAAMV